MATSMKVAAPTTTTATKLCVEPDWFKSKPGALLPCLISVALVLAGLGPGVSRGQALPPAPRSLDDLGAQQLFLELVVNQRATGSVVAVTQRQAHFFVAASDLRAVAIPVDGEGEIAVDMLDQVEVTYESSAQRLRIDVPPAWLPAQFLGRDSGIERVRPRASLGMLFGYDVYLNDVDRGATTASTWNELRLFGDFGAFATTGVYRSTLSGSTGRGDRYIRYDTSWRYADDERMLAYEAGDVVTRALPWSSSIRLGGVQVSKDFAVRPDVITYPLPQFAGDAAVPTSVDLFINGYRSSSDQVQPGPFTITNVPFINGAGEATVVTTDALGRQVATTIPFYVTSALLRQGLSDYSFSGGMIRRQYGLRNFDYGEGAGSASYRFGLTDDLTVETHAEGAGSLALAGIGSVARLGNLGVLNTAYSQSRARDDEGGQLSAGYQYTQRRFNLGLQHIRRGRGFNDLSSYDSRYYQLSRESSQLTGSLQMGAFGSLGSGYFDIKAADGTRTRLLNLSWTQSLVAGSSLYLSANRELGGGNWSSMAQLVMPLGHLGGSVSASVQQGADHRLSQRVNYGRSIPSEGGWGWDLGYGRGDDADDYHQASATWRGRAVQLGGGVYGSQGDYSRWGEARGSLVWLDGQLFAANQVRDAFVLVSTDGQAGVPVRYENQLVGETDAHGHLLVPWATAYYAGKYEIDPLGLAANIDTPIVEQRAAVRAGSGYVLRFPMGRVVAASISLVDSQGEPLPVGAVARLDRGGSAYVGWDGLTYLEGLEDDNRLTVILPEGGQCATRFAIDPQADRIAQIGPLTCR